MKISSCVGFFALLLCLSTAHGGFYTGNDLKAKFDATDAYSQGLSFGYVLGVYDDWTGVLFCAPSGESGVRAGQVQEVVKKYFNENPALLHLRADFLVTNALTRTWPCPKKVETPTQKETPAQRAPTPRAKPKESSPF